MFDTDDTIVAISSAAGCGLRGIVRVSGPAAVALCAPLLQLTDGRTLADLAGFEVADGRIDCGRGPRIPARAILFRAPRSYTRQDVVELHVPAAPPLLRRVIERLAAAGARPAEPGEFTARAFLLGRIDLAQAEAVAAVIAANADSSLRAAQHMLAGELSGELGAVHDALAELAALVELGIDFSDQDIELIRPAELRERLAGLRSRIESLLAGSGRFEDLDRLPRVAVAGRPNVGKSSLANALLGRRRSIVAETPGTTRDVVAEPLTIRRDGAAVTLLLEDRAGLGASADPLAAEADAAARRELAEADAVLFVFDAADGWTDADAALLSALPPAPTVVVGNKIDLLPSGRDPKGSASDAHGGRAPLRVAAKREPPHAMAVSALRGTGIDELRGRLAELVGGTLDRSDAGLMLTGRHREGLAAAAAAIGRAVELSAEELMAAELAQANDALALLLGRRYSDQVLAQVFGRFCIGK